MPASPADYKPSVADLGAIMRARTFVGGEELGTFNTETRPTATTAGLAIDQAHGLVAGRLGNVPTRLASMAKSIVTLRAAMLMETSSFAEEVEPDQGAYGSYREQYRDALADYDAAIDLDHGEEKAGQAHGIASVAMPTQTKLDSDALPA